MKNGPQLTPDQIKKLNELTVKQSEEEYADFENNFKRGICYLCGEKFETFNSSKPCMHWFLRPCGVDKKHLYEVLEENDYFKIFSFLCWIANMQDLLRNVNNLRDEKPYKKV